MAYDHKPKTVKLCTICGNSFFAWHPRQVACCPEHSYIHSLTKGRLRYAQQPLITKQCIVCGNSFTTKWATTQTCSLSHRALSRPKHTLTKKCVVCGKDFVVTGVVTIGQTARNTCSPEHARERERILERARTRQRPKIRQCVICGGDFVVTNPKQKTCSLEHSRLLAMERSHNRPKKPGITKSCAVCDKPFVTKRPYAVTCSPDHSRIFKLRKITLQHSLGIEAVKRLFPDTTGRERQEIYRLLRAIQQEKV